MGVPKRLINSPLLAVPLALRCRATSPVENPKAPCRGVFGDGWHWHGCDTAPEIAHSVHTCPCGHTWPATDRRKN